MLEYDGNFHTQITLLTVSILKTFEFSANVAFSKMLSYWPLNRNVPTIITFFAGNDETHPFRVFEAGQIVVHRLLPLFAKATLRKSSNIQGEGLIHKNVESLYLVLGGNAPLCVERDGY